jgi:hypothetical protein
VLAKAERGEKQRQQVRALTVLKELGHSKQEARTITQAAVSSFTKANVKVLKGRVTNKSDLVAAINNSSDASHWRAPEQVKTKKISSDFDSDQDTEDEEEEDEESHDLQEQIEEEEETQLNTRPKRQVKRTRWEDFDYPEPSASEELASE